MTLETPNQPEEMPETTYPEELFIECRFTDDGDINRITFGNVRYIRADLAAKPDKVDVDVAQAALTNLVNGRTLESDHRIAATRIIKAHLNTRNLIPPVEPVRGDADMDNLADIYIRHTKPDRIQGFYYKPFHVIRDVFKKSDEQEIFRLHEDKPDAREIYEKQHERECVKVGLRRVIAALSQSPAPDLDKIVERLEKLRRKYEPLVDFDLVAIEASNDTLDAAIEIIEAVKQVRG